MYNKINQERMQCIHHRDQCWASAEQLQPLLANIKNKVDSFDISDDDKSVIKFALVMVLGEVAWNDAERKRENE